MSESLYPDSVFVPEPVDGSQEPRAKYWVFVLNNPQNRTNQVTNLHGAVKTAENPGQRHHPYPMNP